MANPISKAPTPSLASGVSEVAMSSAKFSSSLQDLSPIIIVDREPVKVVSFNLSGNARLVVNQIANVGDSEIIEPYRPNGEEIALTASRNEIVLHRSGRYRLEAYEIETEATAFWWQFSMTHEWYDEIAEALRFLCSCVTPNDIQLVSGPGITIENLGGGLWRITNTGILGATESPTVAHEITSGVLNSHVKISEDPNNELFARDDGLYATISDPGVPCAVGQLIQPLAVPVSRLRFVVLDSNNCLRWVTPRSLANYICEYECEEVPPPPTCCALSFNHSVQTLSSVGVGTVITVTLTATGSNAASCYAVTNALNINPLQGTFNGWRLDNATFTGANPLTQVNFNTSNITTWALYLTFVAVECNEVGRTIGLTATGSCRDAQGQVIAGSNVTYPFSVLLPPVTEDCGAPPPPGSCCNLSINSSSSIPTGPIAVGDTATIQITSIATTNDGCHGRLFANSLSSLVGSGWEIASVTPSVPGQDIRTGVNHNAAGSSSITNTIVLRAIECVAASTRSLTVSGACFNNFGNQLDNTYVEAVYTYNLPAVNANCEGSPQDCGISFTYNIISPPTPVSVGDELVVEVTYFGTNGATLRTQSIPSGWPGVPVSSWAPFTYDIIGLPPGFDPVVSSVNFFAANVTQFTIRFRYIATSVNSNSGSTEYIIGSLCVDGSGNEVPGSYRDLRFTINFPPVSNTGGGGGPLPGCCGLNIVQGDLQFLSRSPLDPVHRCDEFSYTITATSTSNTATCHAVTSQFNPTALPPFFAGRYLVYNVIATRADNSPLPPGVDPVNGVDFFTAGINDWKVTVFIRATQCAVDVEPLDYVFNIIGACVGTNGLPIGGQTTYPINVIVPAPTTGCDQVCD